MLNTPPEAGDAAATAVLPSFGGASAAPPKRFHPPALAATLSGLPASVGAFFSPPALDMPRPTPEAGAGETGFLPPFGASTNPSKRPQPAPLAGLAGVAGVATLFSPALDPPKMPNPPPPEAGAGGAGFLPSFGACVAAAKGFQSAGAGLAARDFASLALPGAGAANHAPPSSLPAPGAGAVGVGGFFASPRRTLA